MTELDRILDYFSNLNLKIPCTTYYREFQISDRQVIEEEIASLFHDINNENSLHKLYDRMETGVIPSGLDDIIRRHNNDKLTVYIMFINAVFGYLLRYLPYSFAKTVMVSDVFSPYIDAINEYVFLPSDGDFTL